MSQVLSQCAHAKLNQQEKSDESQPPLKNTLSSSYSVYATAKVASVMIRYEGYSSPAAHPYHALFTANYNTKTRSMVTLSRLFLSDVAFLDVLSHLSPDQLLAQPLTHKSMMLEGTTPVAKHFQYWVLAQGSLTVFFRESQVAQIF